MQTAQPVQPARPAAAASALYLPMSISGMTALVTGASSGIGEAIAWRLAEAGCNLVVTARRLDRLTALKQQLESQYGVRVHPVQLDMRDLPAVTGLTNSLPEPLKQVDILVNNAGLALGVASVADNDLEDAACMLETNVLSVIALTREVVRGMLARNSGHVVNMSSIAGKEAYAGGSMYCASKHALDAYTVAMRHELVGSAIRVTGICPGAVQTEFSVVRFKGDASKADAVYAGMDPLTAADIADNVMYALTRPAHVQICDMLVLATNQSSAKGIARPKLQQAAGA